jgi:hypothetical protein
MVNGGYFSSLSRGYANETLRERLRSANADATRTVQVVNGEWWEGIGQKSPIYSSWLGAIALKGLDSKLSGAD